MIKRLFQKSTSLPPLQSPIKAVTATLGAMRQIYEFALATKDFPVCLHILNSDFKKHTALSIVHTYSLAVRQLCQIVGENCPIECVLGLIHIADYHLHIGEFEEACRMYEAAQAFCIHIVDNQFTKRILRGHIPASMSVYSTKPSHHLRERIMSMFDSLGQCELSQRERATVHRCCADMHLLCSAAADAKQEREAMYACVGRTFDPVCPICLEHMCLDAKETMVLCCFHTVHLQCFSHCKVKMCPLCRAPNSQKPGHGLSSSSDGIRSKPSREPQIQIPQQTTRSTRRTAPPATRPTIISKPMALAVSGIGVVVCVTAVLKGIDIGSF